MRKRKYTLSSYEAPRLEMTPLVDVVFLLMTFFLAALVVIRQTGFEDYKQALAEANQQIEAMPTPEEVTQLQAEIQSLQMSLAERRQDQDTQHSTETDATNGRDSALTWFGDDLTLAEAPQSQQLTDDQLRTLHVLLIDGTGQWILDDAPIVISQAQALLSQIAKEPSGGRLLIMLENGHVAIDRTESLLNLLQITQQAGIAHLMWGHVESERVAP